MAEVLGSHGWEAAEVPADADLIIVNTCSVREKTEQKLRVEVDKLAPYKAARPHLVLAIAGCIAQQDGQKLIEALPEIDIVIGPDNIAELPELVHEQSNGALPVVRTMFDLDAPRFMAAQPIPGRAPTTAFVTTMKGCDERCSFCIVPHTRGPERYRPVNEIISEAARWVDAGSREIILIGQTVDSYRDSALPASGDDPDETQFPALLRLIAREVPELMRLRYVSPHPRHATSSLAAAHAELDVLARHIHLPAQSGSDSILKRMIRRYRRAEYITRAKRLLAARSNMTLSTDLIVGFPGETDADFEDTLSLVREVGFTSAYTYEYSPRPFTAALKLKDDVPAPVKAERLERLTELIATQTRAHLAGLVGTRQRVLIDGISRSTLSRKSAPRAAANGRVSFQGRTEQNEIVHVESPQGVALVGELVEVLITNASDIALDGEFTPETRLRLTPTPQIERHVALNVAGE
jgi:tRNA-2-methylthio-N6-dimethylallyladenosine synthase